MRFEWVFGQSFDEHQDQFVTLNNRNLTKIILEKFDTDAQTSSLPFEDSKVTFLETKKIMSDNSQKHQKLIFEI